MAIKNDITKYPEEARRLIYRGYDLRSRWMLVNLAEKLWFPNGVNGIEEGTQEEKSAVATLMHAADYLQDRLAYELYPAPKGMIRMEA